MLRVTQNKRTIARSRYYVHMYIRKQAQVNYVHKVFMYNTEGVDCDLPQFIFGEHHYLHFYSKIVEQIVPLYNF